MIRLNYPHAVRVEIPPHCLGVLLLEMHEFAASYEHMTSADTAAEFDW